MRRPPSRPLALALAAGLLGGCAAAPSPSDWAAVREVTPGPLIARPAADPALAGDARGRVALTWVTRGGAGGDLWLALSRDSGVTFGPAVRVNPSPGTVLSGGEGRPVAAWGPGGRLAIAWSSRAPGGAALADLVVRTSADGGGTLGPVVTVNDDSLAPPVDHGCAALAFRPDGALFAAWLESGSPRGAGPAALFGAASLDGGRSWSENAMIADSLCAGARPAVACAEDGRLALAWRAVRGVAVAFSGDGGTTFEPARALAGGRDGPCPADGPALAALGAGGVAAWAGADGGVDLAPWTFGRGASGPPRALLDSLARGAHPRAVPFGAGALLAVDALPWADSVGVVAVRALEGDGAMTPWLFLGAGARDGWLAPLGPRAALAAWVEGPAARPRVRLARIERASTRR